MKKFISILSILLIFICKLETFGQGCSDAGFCTIGNLSAYKKDSIQLPKHTIAIALPFGVGDEDVFVITPSIEYNRFISNRISLQGKITANYATGNLGTAFGAGDLFLSGTFMLPAKSKWNSSLTLGTKLPLNQSNLKEDGKSLPMQYQSSLGTVDIITGFSLSNTRWQFAAGWQQPVTGTNGNNFLPVYWNKPEAESYPPSNDFNRKGDVLIRTAYSFGLTQQVRITTGVLGIYHLGEDEYIDGNVQSTPIAIQGSRGLTLNATAATVIPVSKKLSVGISGGVPLVVRDVRPDGLTRSFVLNTELKYNF